GLGDVYKSQIPKSRMFKGDPLGFVGKAKQRLLSARQYKPRRSKSYHVPASFNLKRFLKTVWHFLMIPFRVVYHYKVVILITLTVLYGLFSFTEAGKAFLFRLNPQAYYLNTSFLAHTEIYFTNVISQSKTLSAVFRVSPSSVTPTAAPANGAAVKRMVVTASKGLYLRSAPMADSKKLILMKPDTRVEYLNEKTQDRDGVLWYKVKLAEGTVGWANASWLKEV
ncbi:MAG: SH3 domain-containing protein, partial [Clostridia bacterium]|nr:SH3 domain-containing protein [Clostridia bacterium]